MECSKGQNLLRMLGQAEQMLGQAEQDEELGVKQGRDILRMISCPALCPQSPMSLNSLIKQNSPQSTYMREEVPNRQPAVAQPCMSTPVRPTSRFQDQQDAPLLASTPLERPASRLQGQQDSPLLTFAHPANDTPPGCNRPRRHTVACSMDERFMSSQISSEDPPPRPSVDGVRNFQAVQRPILSTTLVESPFSRSAKQAVLPFTAPPLLAGIPSFACDQQKVPATPQSMPPGMPMPVGMPAFGFAPPNAPPANAPPRLPVQGSEVPPPCHTPRLPMRNDCWRQAPQRTGPLGRSLEGTLAGGTLSTGASGFSYAERRTPASFEDAGPVFAFAQPLAVGLIPPSCDKQPAPSCVSSSPTCLAPVTTCSDGNACQVECLGEAGGQSPVAIQSHDEAPVLCRSSSDSSLDQCTQYSDESNNEIDSFVPANHLQTFDYPLSKSEKRLLYTQICDKERAAAVQELKQHKRRMSMGKSSRASTGSMSRRVSIADTQYDPDENDIETVEDKELLVKKREKYEHKLQDVNRRLSRSRP